MLVRDESRLTEERKRGFVEELQIITQQSVRKCVYLHINK